MTIIRFQNQPTMNKALAFNNQDGTTSDIRANIYRNENNFAIELAVPGYCKEDFSIEIEEQLLTISAAEKAQELGDEKFLRREFAVQGVNKSFKVPKSIDVDNISAEYNNGILLVKLPMLKDVKIKKEIAIS